MAKILRDLESKLRREPQAIVNLIVRCQGDVDACAAKAQARGLQVRHTYTLISALALQGTAAAALALLEEPWVVSLEEDKTVHTM